MAGLSWNIDELIEDRELDVILCKSVNAVEGLGCVTGEVPADEDGICIEELLVEGKLDEALCDVVGTTEELWWDMVDPVAEGKELDDASCGLDGDADRLGCGKDESLPDETAGNSVETTEGFCWGNDEKLDDDDEVCIEDCIIEDREFVGASWNPVAGREELCWSVVLFVVAW